MSKILNFEVLLKFNNCNKARELLHIIANNVECILKKHNWIVENFCEFCPKDKKLLGLNIDRGETIRIRLRQCDNEHEFIPVDQLIDTMLHELAHIQEANHSKKFYKLWDELREEWEQNAVNSHINPTKYTNNGNGNSNGNSDGNSNGIGEYKLNPNYHNPSSMRDARMKAVAAAEKRAKLSELMSSGPKRLCDLLTDESQLSPREAVRIATLTRLNGSTWCGIDDTVTINQPWSCQQCTTLNSETFQKCIMCKCPKSCDTWDCEKCTLSNLETFDECSMCGHNRNDMIIEEEDVRFNQAIDEDVIEKVEVDNGELNDDEEVDDDECINDDEKVDDEVDEKVDDDCVDGQGVDGEGVEDEGIEDVNNETWTCKQCTVLNSILLQQCSVCGSSNNESDHESSVWACSECTFLNNNTIACEICEAQRTIK